MAPFSFRNFGSSSTSSTPPKKYTTINGVTKLNPAWIKWKNQQGGQPATTSHYPKHALPVVTSMEEHELLCEASVAKGGRELPLAEATIATMDIMQEPETAHEVGMQSDEVFSKLSKVLGKYEIPMGLVNKLIILSEFEILEFMVDDSGSMNHVSDTVDANRKPQTRWQEAKARLKAMLEILAYVPFQEIQVCFLNRSQRLSFTRDWRTPQLFLNDAYRQIDSAFSSPPAGTTPVLERIHESLARGEGKNVSRYLFCDGVPDGGNHAKAEIVRILMTRQNPQQNPYTFLSCTGEDDQVEWMKDAEEAISYCAECDDFNDEADEVYKDQGKALPFTYGFYLICSLVAAMNPYDLDAMDESIPFTKATLDNLLGIQHDERSYRHYFDCFLKAQRKRPIERDDFGRPKRTDQIKKNFRWEPLYQDLLMAPLSCQIPAVQEFKKQLLQ